MATIKKLKTQIENANALGVANLTEKGVEVSSDATTYEIMQSIAEVSSGGGGAEAILTVAPVVKATADIEPCGEMLMSVENAVYIVGNGAIGETLSVASDKINVDMCDLQWANRVVKYSHTPNIDDNGVQNGTYGSSYHNTEVVTIEGAETLSVTLKYATESGCDYVTVFEGNHPDYSYSTSGYLEKLCGSGEKTFTVNGDSVTFAFRSDGSTNYYGYYATVVVQELIDGAVGKEYTVQSGDTSIACFVYGKGDYYGETVTESILIEE